MLRFYAIGDVHGHVDKLHAVHALIAADRKEVADESALVLHLGDLCDRGPDSRGVIDTLIAGIAEGAPWQVIRGNHDQMLLDFLDFEDAEDPRYPNAEFWVESALGGLDTLRSYGVEVGSSDLREAQDNARRAVPPAHQSFLRALPHFFETPELLFVHAGIRPGIPLMQQYKDDLIWIREEFLFDDTNHGPLVVHGHTPVDVPEHWGNRVNLDTGAGFGRRLTGAVFEGRDCFILTEKGRVPLHPYRSSRAIGDGALS